MEEAKKVSESDAFLDGMKIGILVRRGIKLEIEGKMLNFVPGDVVRPSAGDLKGPGHKSVGDCGRKSLPRLEYDRQADRRAIADGLQDEETAR